MTIEEYRKKKLDIYRNISNNIKFSKDNACSLELCRKCDGACCKSFPCAFSSDDFIDINDLDYMKNIMDTGLFVIDNYIVFPAMKDRIYFIRSRGIKDEDLYIYDRAASDNECIFHNIDGCLLDFYTRPSEGALLVPNKNKYGLGVCSNHYSLSKLKEDWLAHQDVMKELISYYQGRKIVKHKPDNKMINSLVLKLRNGD